MSWLKKVANKAVDKVSDAAFGKDDKVVDDLVAEIEAEQKKQDGNGK